MGFDKVFLACFFILAAGASVLFCVFGVTFVFPSFVAFFHLGDVLRATVSGLVLLVIFMLPVWLVAMAYIGFRN